MRVFTLGRRRWIQHLRALAVLVSLLSLSLLFSTFTGHYYTHQSGDTTDGQQSALIDHGQRAAAAAEGEGGDSSTSTKSIIVASSSSKAVLTGGAGNNKDRRSGFVLPAPAALLRSRNLFVNRTLTQNDIAEALNVLIKRLEEGRKQLRDEFNLGPTLPAAYWNTSHPQRLLVVTSWRSGSTFLGQILSEYPGVFNHYEPLMHLGLRQVRPSDHPESEEAVHHLKNLLQCRYANEEFLRKVGENVQDMLSHNAHVWQACLLGPNRNACASSSFLERSCRLFPTIMMKIVRLRLNLTSQLLEDPSLGNLKVLYLVRDPRATMNSRLLSVDWCNRSADCIDPARLCEDLQSDLDAYDKLSAQYPGRLALVKYETLATYPQETFRGVFDFAGLFYTRRIRQVVERHTSRDENHPWSTIRKSVERVDRWQTKLDKQTISEIQAVCSDVLARLGYAQL